MSTYRSNYVPWNKSSISSNQYSTSKSDSATTKSKYDSTSLSRPSSRADNKADMDKTGSSTKLNTAGSTYRPTSSASAYSNLRDRSASRGPDKYGASDTSKSTTSTKDKYTSSQEKLASGTSSLRDKYSSSSGTYPGRTDLTSRLKSAVDKITTAPPVTYRTLSRTGSRSRDPSPATSRDHDKSDVGYRLYTPRTYTRSTSREPEPSSVKYTSGLSSRAGSASREDLSTLTARYNTSGRISRLDSMDSSTAKDELTSTRLRSTSRQARDDISTSSSLPRYTSSRHSSKEDLTVPSSSKYINSRFLPKNTIEKSYTTYNKPTSSIRSTSSIEDKRRSRDNLLVVLQTQKSIANSPVLKSPKQENTPVKSPVNIPISKSKPGTPTKSPLPVNRKESSEEETSEEESSTETEEEVETVTVITRGTSPTPPSQSSSIRTRRTDMARILQKDITRPKKRNLSNMLDKEMQSDRLDDTARYSRFGSSSSVSAAPWSSYLDLKYSSPRSSPSRYSTTSNNSSKGQDSQNSSKDNLKLDKASKENILRSETGTSISENKEAKLPTSSKNTSPEKNVTKIAKKSSSSSSESINSLSRNNSIKSINQKSEGKPKSIAKSRSSSLTSDSKSSSSLVVSKSTTSLETSSSKKQAQTSIETSSTNSKKQLPPPVPKSDSPAKVIPPSGVPNKDFRKSVLNMNTDGKPNKKLNKRSSSVSSDSEPSSVATGTESQINDLTSLSKSTSLSLPKVKSSGSIGSLSKLPQRVSPSPKSDKDLQKSRRSPSACSESSNCSSISSSEDDAKKSAKKNLKSVGSSRTSMLLSSADELSIEKSAKPPPSPRTKSEGPKTEAEAKSFLMRALAPVTNFFKVKQQDSDADNINWMESPQSINNSDKEVISKKSTDTNSTQNSEKSGSKIKFKFDKPDSGEEPWWMSDNTDIPEGVQIVSSNINGSNGELEVKDGKHIYKIRRNESGKVEWWLDSSDDSIKNKQQYKLRHQDSGEKAWWLMSHPNIPEGIQNLDDESSSDEDPDKPLGDRASPEGLEMPSSGRLSPYDNIPSTTILSSQNKSLQRPDQLPLFISRHTNIDDILGGGGQLLSPLMDRIFSLQEKNDCEEVDPGQVTIHDSTAQRPVIQPNRIDVIKDSPKSVSACEKFLNDIDPFSYSAAFPEPARPPLHTFSVALPLINQLAAVHRALQAPHRLDDAALQLYKDGDYGSYLDLEASISEQQEEFEGFQSSKKNSIVLRTQLSVRVHTIIEKLLTSEGRELRRALFSLKQIFQEDKDLVHEFVQNDGLACLIKVGSEADQNYQNYILRALGQVMLYVDGMNGVMEHNQTVQWLYTLIASKFRLVVKTALKLLLVFVEYIDSNCMLLIKAVNIVDGSQGLLAWSNIMRLLKDFNSADTELLIYAMTLINKCLNGIPDQDTYYDQTDALEEQGIEAIIQRYMSKQGTDLDLLQQFQIYEAVLQHEDGEDKSMPLRHLDESIRKTLRNRKSVLDNSERRKSRRHSTGNTPTTIQNANKMKFYSLQTSTVDDEDESSSSQSSGHNDHNLNGSYKENNKANDAGVTPALRRRRERAERQRSFIREQQESAAILRASLGIAEDNENGTYTNSLQQRMANGNLQLSRNCSRKDLTPLMNAVNKLDTSEDGILKKPWVLQMMYNKPSDENLQTNEDISENTNENDRKMLLQLKRENTVKDLTQKLSSQNILHNTSDENQKINLNRIGDMCGLISKAKEGLAKSKSKGDIMKSPTLENIPKVEAKKSENELRWEELVNGISRPLNLCDLDFTDLQSEDEVDILAPTATTNGIPPPPPPLCKESGPPPPPIGTRNPPPFPTTPCFGVNLQRPQRLCQEQANKASNSSNGASSTIKKNKKTVKLFWKEVRDDPIALTKLQKCGGMIWDELNPVNIDTQKLEHLFESRAKDLISKKQQEMNKNKEIIVLDHKRSNAINIGMTKLPPPRSIKTAILKMDATIMNREGIEKLLTMLPTEEERTKIQEAQTANPDLPLGSAEQFLLTLASISELPARLKLWAFKLDFENLEREIAEPLMDLKQGIELLKGNKTFRGILSTLLSIGIFLNGAEVKGFQIEYLAKVPEVKDTVHKHSLLHHLCHIVMEKFPEASDLYSEIGAITRASKIDFDELSLNIQKLEADCKASWDHLKLIAKHDGSTMMKVKMSDFLADCAERIILLDIIHRRVMNRYHKFLLWLGIPLHRVADSKPNEFCRVVSEFALEYRTTRERVLQQIEKKANHRERNKTRGKMITEVGKFRTKEDRADAELRQLLGSDISDVESMQGTLPWRRTRRDPHSGSVLNTPNGNLTDDGDDEILETLVKTATKAPASRATPRERKRTRHADRKSLRRTLKNGLSEEEKKHIAAYIKGY